MEGSAAKSLNIHDRKKILTMLGRGILYAMVTFLIIIVTNLNVPTEYAFLIPIVTTLLNTASYAIKRYMQENKIPPLPTPEPPV